MLVVWIAALSLGAAPTKSPDLAAAERAYAEGSYQAVLPALRQAWRGPLSLHDIHRALELEALAHTAFDQAEPAIQAFQFLLAEDPQYLPDAQASPKVLAFFAEARRRGPLGITSHGAASAAVRPPWTQPPPPAPAPEGHPLYTRWWFWTGAAVIAGAAGAAAWYELHPIVPSGKLGVGQMQ